ncbi:MAG: glycosyltransferase family 2 protein [Succinivibrio sp.]|nr:glycosyltransferase family 2 protein [Succinivibrio sp.]
MLTIEDKEKIHNVASEKLQIIIVTYNRAQYLERTLNCLLDKDSPVREVDILVQNNCSTDNTKAVCEKFKKKYQNFSYITNRYNVGGCVNVAKAYENFSKDYLWILGDDDVYDWSNWFEVEVAIYNGEKAILVSTVKLPSCYKDNLSCILSSAALVSGAIISKHLVTSTVVKNCYEKAAFLFPHIIPLVSYINGGGKFYVCKKSIVMWGGFQNKNNNRCFTFGDDATVLNKRSASMTAINGFIGTVSDLQDQQLKYAITRMLIERGFWLWVKKRDGRKTIDAFFKEAIKNHYFYNLLDIYQGADPEYQKYIIDVLFERKDELLYNEELDRSSKYLVDKDIFSEFSERNVGIFKIKANIIKVLLDQYLPCTKGNVVIWGTGKYGQYIYRTLTYLIPSIKIEAFVDSFVQDDADNRLFNKPIVSPKIAYEKYKNAWFIIASEAFEQIISSIPKVLNLNVVDTSCRLIESFQIDFEGCELSNLIGLSWADYSYAVQNKNAFNSVKEYNSIFEDEESRLSYEKLCSILFESTFDELTYFFRLSENPNVLVKEELDRIKITDNDLEKNLASNNQQINFVRTNDDVIEVIQNCSKNSKPLFITVDVGFSKKSFIGALLSLDSNISLDVIVRSTADLIELPKLYKEHLSNKKSFITKNKDNQILISIR